MQISIPNSSPIPDVALKPFQLAQRFQAAASRALAQEDRLVLEDQTLPALFMAHMNKATEDRLIPNPLSWPGNTPAAISKAAKLMWAIGLMQLQRLIAAGEWFPPTLDPLVFPDADEMLDFGAAKDHTNDS